MRQFHLIQVVAFMQPVAVLDLGCINLTYHPVALWPTSGPHASKPRLPCTSSDGTSSGASVVCSLRPRACASAGMLLTAL